MHNVFFEGLNISMAKTRDGLQVDRFTVYLSSQDFLVGLAPVATYGDGICFFASASILAYVTEDSHSSLRTPVIKKLNVHSGYYLTCL